MDYKFSQILTDLINVSGKEKKVIANEIQVSSGNMSKWTQGQALPNSDCLYKLANYFNVSTDYLLTGNDAQLKDFPEFTSKINLLSDENKKKASEYLDFLLSTQK